MSGGGRRSRAKRGRAWIGRTRDARGRVVRLFDPYPLWVIGRDEPIERDVLSAIVEDLGVPEARSRRSQRLAAGIISAGVVIVVAGIGGMLYREGRAAARDVVTSLVMFGPMSVAIIWVSVWGAKQKRMGVLRGVMLRHSRCPGCGYGLVGVPAEGGVVVCPECEAAWEAGLVGVGEHGAGGSARARYRAAALVALAGLGALAIVVGMAMVLLR